MYIRDTLDDNTLHEVKLDVKDIILRSTKVDKIMLPCPASKQDIFPKDDAMVMICLRRSHSGPEVALDLVSTASHRRYGIECSVEEKMSILDPLLLSAPKKDRGLSEYWSDIFNEIYIWWKNMVSNNRHSLQNF